MLLCSDNSIYTGCTNDLLKRIKAHNLGKGARYTRARGPVKLAWSEKTACRSSAQILESKLKKLSRTLKLKTLLNAPINEVNVFLDSETLVSRFVEKI